MEKEFLYMKKWNAYSVCIMYHLGAYYVTKVKDFADGRMCAVTIRRYKTLSGAERYLKEKVTGVGDTEGIDPELKFGTEAFIKEGSYWRA